MNMLRYKIAQMLIIGFSGCEIDEQSPVVQWLRKDGVGGVLLFDFDLKTKQYGKNLKTQAQIKQLTQQLKDIACEAVFNEDKLPLFIAIDYEGGAVDRLTKIEGCPSTLSAKTQGTLTENALFLEAEKMALTLKTLGFNLNFAPVIDLNLNEQAGIIGKWDRCFSSHANDVIKAARTTVRAYHKQGIIGAYKHFPGHGSATGDTHEGFVDVTLQYQPCELIPYQTLLNDSQLPPTMVMTAHVINRHLDDSGLPATLSYRILTELLRREIGFDGVIISDDLQMQAISDHYSLEDALCLTINAGADMLIFGNQLGEHQATDIIDGIESLVKAGKIASSRIEEAYVRIKRLKHSF